jgi:putative endonuclease
MCAANTRGKIGEDYAAKILKSKGWRVLERNYSSRFGEIDIIAQKGDILSFIEVKLRASDALTSPGAAVNLAKRRKIIKTAMVYMAHNPSLLQPRFDVVEVIEESKRLNARHIEGAFDVEGGA